MDEHEREMVKARLEYEKLIWLELSKIAKCLENIKDHGIIAYPSA